MIVTPAQFLFPGEGVADDEVEIVALRRPAEAGEDALDAGDDALKRRRAGARRG